MNFFFLNLWAIRASHRSAISIILSVNLCIKLSVIQAFFAQVLLFFRFLLQTKLFISTSSLWLLVQFSLQAQISSKPNDGLGFPQY